MCRCALVNTHSLCPPTNSKSMCLSCRRITTSEALVLKTGAEGVQSRPLLFLSCGSPSTVSRPGAGEKAGSYLPLSKITIPLCRTKGEEKGRVPGFARIKISAHISAYKMKAKGKGMLQCALLSRPGNIPTEHLSELPGPPEGAGLLLEPPASGCCRPGAGAGERWE